MKIAIVYNQSLSKYFLSYAEALKKEFELLSVCTEIYTNAEILSKSEFDFIDCVFLDKDISCGLYLESKGIRCYNNIGAIETCDDKSRTFILLKDFFRFPKSVIVPYYFNLDRIDIKEYSSYLVKELGLPLIIKEAKSSLGEGVFLFISESELTDFLKKTVSQQLIASEYIKESSGKDVRVYVVGNKVIASMARINDYDFRSNISLGGHGIPYSLTDEEKNKCVEIAKSIGLDFCGIDLLLKDDRPYYLCEVNSNAMFNELNKVCKVNIAKEIAEYIFEKLTKENK